MELETKGTFMLRDSEKGAEILMEPDKLPEIFFMKETIPGGVLNDMDSLLETGNVIQSPFKDSYDSDELPYYIPIQKVLPMKDTSAEMVNTTNTLPEIAPELPPLSVQNEELEDLSWLKKIVEYNSIEHNETSCSTTREDTNKDNKDADFSNVSDIWKMGEEKKASHNCVEESKSNNKTKLKINQKQVTIEEPTNTDEDSNTTDTAKRCTLFQFCEKHLFLLVYMVLGLVIMVLTVLNLVFGFKPVLLISLIVMVFILLVLLTD